MTTHVSAVDDRPARSVWFDSRPLPESVRDSVDSLPIEDLVDLVLEKCSLTVFPHHRQDTEFMARLRTSVSHNAYALRDVLAGATQLDEVELGEMLTFATVQAQLRIPQKSMQRSYRISFFVQWEMWTAHVRRWIRSRGLPCDEAAEVLSQLTRVILTYQDHVASQVAETYTRDYDALNRSRAHVRKSLVRDVLRGEVAELTATDLAILAYPLDAHHVAVLLPDVPEGAASQLCEALRTAARAHQTLTFPLTLNSTVVWLCSLDPWRPSALKELGRSLETLGTTASVSNASGGAGGFASCLHQAEEAERIRVAWGPHNAPPVIHYADAGLEILLLQNDELARSFVNAELGPLAQNTVEAARLRETLEASFRLGSHVAAADALQLHEHTVRNRLHKVEELLGHSLQERRMELQVSVRLMRLLGEETETRR